MLKKIVLFIVEGESEEQALGPILTKIIASNRVKFKVVKGDITADYYARTVSEVIPKIKQLVNEFLGSVYRTEDIEEIVHIVDTDGAFIQDSALLYKDVSKVIYNNKSIETANVHEMKKRNMYKSSVLSLLSQTQSIKFTRTHKLPYMLCFMSFSLDHVIHNQPNLDPPQKKLKAIDFSDQYYQKETEFYHFLKSPTILKSKTFISSWQAIRNGFNSLDRQSNLAFYLEKYFRP